MQTATTSKRSGRMMTGAEFIAFAREQAEAREARGKAQAETRYALVQIGRNPNSAQSYGLMSADGVLWQFVAGRVINRETQEANPDQVTVGAWNKRLAELGAGFKVFTKHWAARETLFAALAEVND